MHQFSHQKYQQRKKNYNPLLHCLHKFQKNQNRYQFNVKITKMCKKFKRYSINRDVTHIKLAVCKRIIMHIDKRYIYLECNCVYVCTILSHPPRLSSVKPVGKHRSCSSEPNPYLSNYNTTSYKPAITVYRCVTAQRRKQKLDTLLI